MYSRDESSIGKSLDPSGIMLTNYNQSDSICYMLLFACRSNIRLTVWTFFCITNYLMWITFREYNVIIELWQQTLDGSHVRRFQLTHVAYLPLKMCLLFSYTKLSCHFKLKGKIKQHILLPNEENNNVSWHCVKFSCWKWQKCIPSGTPKYWKLI